MSVAALALPAAVLWDLDGTLVDSEPHWMAAQQDLARRWRVSWTRQEALSTVGNPLRQTAARLAARGVRSGIDEIVEELTTYTLDRLVAAVPWRPGALELIAQLDRWAVPSALVTMSHSSLVSTLLSTTGAPRFGAVVTGDAVQHAKPHPEPYLRAAALLGVDPERTLVVEDSAAGIASAEAAGAAVLAIGAGDSAARRLAVGSLEGLDLPAVWERLVCVGGRDVRTAVALVRDVDKMGSTS